MSQAEPWELTLGSRPRTVRLYERGPTVWIYYRSGGVPVRRSLGRGIRSASGKRIPAAIEWATEQGNGMLGMLLSPLSSSRVNKSLTILESINLIQDPDRGLYPENSQHRREVLRSMRFAAETWGNKQWREVRRDDFTALGRARVRVLRARDHVGYRGAEKLVKDVMGVANWLRDKERIPGDSGMAPRRWVKDLKAFWRKYSGVQVDYKPARPRHSVDEYRRLLPAAWRVDPRFGLMLDLGAGFRFGQVVRIRRSHLEVESGHLEIPGTAEKPGAHLILTSGQQASVARALSGHLRPLEERWAAEGVDYNLFPQGKLPQSGVIEADRGHVSRPCLSRWFLAAEGLAGIPHMEGRGAHGLRRMTVDHALSEKISLSGLQAAGGWANADMPTRVYAEHHGDDARAEASRFRADLRGETDPTCTPIVHDDETRKPGNEAATA
jgi:integrase